MLNLFAVVVLVVVSFIRISVAADSCIQCTSETDRRCVTTPHHIDTTLCSNNNGTNGCYSRIVDGYTVRGCLADIVDLQCRDEPLCSICMNMNNGIGCNNQLFPEIRLFCHQCYDQLSSTCGDDILTTAQICRIYRADDECFIRRTLSVIHRGCISDIGNICIPRDNCFICDGHGCNSFNATYEQIPLDTSSASLAFSSIAVMVAMLVTANIFQKH